MEIKDFAYCLEDYELVEVRTIGAFYTWTNKILWSRIDRVLANNYQFRDIEYTHATTTTEGLSDHTPLKIIFLTYPKSNSKFMFYEMWCSDPKFKKLYKSSVKLRTKAP